MPISEWHCPTCKQRLFVTENAEYWCSTCNAKRPVEQVDQMGRDYVRLKVEMEHTFMNANMLEVAA